MCDVSRLENGIVKVRQFREEDTAQWIRMRVALWPEERESIEKEGVDPLRDEAIPLKVFVAENDGRIEGFIEVSLRPYAEGCISSPVPYVEGWFVEATRRRRGIGRALVEAAIEWARSQGHMELASDILVTNDGSRAAHLAIGFEEVETITVFRREI